jgi:hypothetical protein
MLSAIDYMIPEMDPNFLGSSFGADDALVPISAVEAAIDALRKTVNPLLLNKLVSLENEQIKLNQFTDEELRKSEALVSAMLTLTPTSEGLLFTARSVANEIARRKSRNRNLIIAGSALAAAIAIGGSMLVIRSVQ